MLYIILSLIILPFAVVGIHGYINGVLAPKYDPQKMTLNFERIGNGPKKIIMLHGLTGSLNYWKRGLNDLLESHSLLLIDLLGFGDSPKPNSKYNLEEHVEALKKVIEKVGFDSGDALIVGHSLGAILTMGLAKKYPNWFSGLVVIGLPFYQGQKEIIKKLSTISIWRGISVNPRYKFVCFFHPIYMMEWFRPKNIPKDVFRDAGKHTWVSYYHTLDKVILETDLIKIADQIKNKKILFIHGDKDDVAPFEVTIRLVPIFDKAKFHIIPDTDHQVFLECPEKIWSLIKDFSNEIRE